MRRGEEVKRALLDKRKLEHLDQLRKARNLSAKEVSTMTGLTPSYVSKAEKGQLNPSALSGLALANAVGMRLDDVLKLSGPGQTLVNEYRPFIRVPHTLTAQSELVRKVEEFNQPNLVEQYYRPGNAQSRLDLLIVTTKKIAEVEAQIHQSCADPSTLPGRCEFVELPSLQKPLDLETMPTKLEVGEAFSYLIEHQNLRVGELAKRVDMSRSFVNDLQKNRGDVSVSNLDLVARAVGLTVDELIWCEVPSRTRWIFFVQQHYSWAYHNQKMMALVTSAETLANFKRASVENRVRMMIAYKNWLRAEWEAHLNPTYYTANPTCKDSRTQLYLSVIPDIFRLDGFWLD